MIDEESEFSKQISALFREKLQALPSACDFCDYFSGNSVAPGVRPAFCNNVKSRKYQKHVEAGDTCKNFSNVVN